MLNGVGGAVMSTPQEARMFSNSGWWNMEWFCFGPAFARHAALMFGAGAGGPRGFGASSAVAVVAAQASRAAATRSILPPMWLCRARNVPAGGTGRAGFSGEVPADTVEYKVKRVNLEEAEALSQ